MAQTQVLNGGKQVGGGYRKDEEESLAEGVGCDLRPQRDYFPFLDLHYKWPSTWELKITGIYSYTMGVTKSKFKMSAEPLSLSRLSETPQLSSSLDFILDV